MIGTLSFTPMTSCTPRSSVTYRTRRARSFASGTGGPLHASLAVIGSRRATPYGLTVAEMAATVAAESGVTVVLGRPPSGATRQPETPRSKREESMCSSSAAVRT